MNQTFAINKFHFSESSPSLKLTEELKAEFIRKDVLKIELIEIEDIQNPSDLIVLITTEGHLKTETPFYLYKFRTKFLYQEGKFILDTQDIEDFEIQVGGRLVDIKILANEGINKFKVTMYYRALFQNEL